MVQAEEVGRARLRTTSLRFLRSAIGRCSAAVGMATEGLPEGEGADRYRRRLRLPVRRRFLRRGRPRRAPRRLRGCRRRRGRGVGLPGTITPTRRERPRSGRRRCRRARAARAARRWAISTRGILAPGRRRVERSGLLRRRAQRRRPFSPKAAYRRFNSRSWTLRVSPKRAVLRRRHPRHLRPRRRRLRAGRRTPTSDSWLARTSIAPKRSLGSAIGLRGRSVGVPRMRSSRRGWTRSGGATHR